jgi:hypothetical protein
VDSIFSSIAMTEKATKWMVAAKPRCGIDDAHSLVLCDGANRGVERIHPRLRICEHGPVNRQHGQKNRSGTRRLRRLRHL